MGVPMEKVRDAVHDALENVEYALTHAENELDRLDLEDARKALRCIEGAHERVR